MKRMVGLSDILCEQRSFRERQTLLEPMLATKAYGMDINSELGNQVIKSMQLNSIMRMNILTYFFTLGLNYLVGFIFP